MEFILYTIRPTMTLFSEPRAFVCRLFTQVDSPMLSDASSVCDMQERFRPAIYAYDHV